MHASKWIYSNSVIFPSYHPMRNKAKASIIKHSKPNTQEIKQPSYDPHKSNIQIECKRGVIFFQQINCGGELLRAQHSFLALIQIQQL